MHYVLPPIMEHFLIPSDKPSMLPKENRACLQLECPNPKYVPHASMCETRQRQGDFVQCIQNNQMGQFSLTAMSEMMAGQGS